MLFLKSIEDYKTLTSGLRRELGLTMSHNRVREALARALGHKNFAALASAQPAPVVTAPALCEDNSPWPTAYLFETENGVFRTLAERPYQLFNCGSLDLVKTAVDARLVSGLYLAEIEGTVEDILNSRAEIATVVRGHDGDLELSYSGDTDVNWDGQVTRVDGRDQRLWETDGYSHISEDVCIAVPLNFGFGSLLDDGVEDCGLPVRELLVDRAVRCIRETGQTRQAIAELADESSIRAACETLSDDAPFALGRVQSAVGFQMHMAELLELKARLSAD